MTPARIVQSPEGWLDTGAVQAGTLAAGRRYQQDAFACGEMLWAVADGMGGHRDGDVAARVALEVLCRTIDGPVDEESLYAAFSAANAAVLALVEPGEMRPPGSTLVTAVLRTGGGLLVASSGDSRAYLVRANGRCIQYTNDHEDSSGALTAYLGDPRSEGVHVDIHAVPAEQGLKVLLCSDGLFGHIKHADLEDLLRGGLRHLLDSAAATSRDNVTAMLLDLDLLSV